MQLCNVALCDTRDTLLLIIAGSAGKSQAAQGSALVANNIMSGPNSDLQYGLLYYYEYYYCTCTTVYSTASNTLESLKREASEYNVR